MRNLSRAIVAPAYLFACLILGGSVQGIWQNMILQLAGIAIIAWAALDHCEEPLSPAGRQLFILALLTICLVAFQLIPMPSSLWVHGGPRGRIADGFHTLGVGIPWEPLSLTPGSGLDALFRMIPAIAMVCGMLRLRAYAPQWLAVALIAGTLAGIALGAMQVVSSSVQVSPLYLYEDTSVGRAVGFFANADHMATLLVITLPFLAATASAARGANVQRYSAVVSIAIGLAIVIGVGVALNGSLAGYVLMPPVIAGSALVVIRARRDVRVGIMVLAAVLFLGSVIAVEATAIGGERIGQHTTTAVQSRAELLSTTTRAAFDFLPWGSGLGSFQKVYPLYEAPKLVTATYVIHAHNDYVEVALELGALGIVLMALFLAWWGAAVWRVWRTAESAPFVRAAAIASAAIIAHSLVDFPLRTSAISACFGMCVALLAGGRVAAQQDGAQLRRTRHVVI